MQTQQQFIEQQLRTYGAVSRNFALGNQISRLSAIICDMNNKGYHIEASNVRGKNLNRWGKRTMDCVYSVVLKPRDKIYGEVK